MSDEHDLPPPDFTVPNFDVRDEDIVGIEQFDEGFRLLAKKLYKGDKMATWMAQEIVDIKKRLYETSRVARRHEQVLGPIRSMIIFFGGAAGIVSIVIHLVKAFAK